MQAIRSIHNVTGPTITIDVPASLSGKQVEVTVLTMESSPTSGTNLDSGLEHYVVPKPVLTEGQMMELERNPFPLRGTGGEYVNPYESAVPLDDWEACRDDPA